MDFRIEKDSMGEMQVPANALYAAQTQRAVENFPISARGLACLTARSPSSTFLVDKKGRLFFLYFPCTTSALLRYLYLEGSLRSSSVS